MVAAGGEAGRGYVARLKKKNVSKKYMESNVESAPTLGGVSTWSRDGAPSEYIGMRGPWSNWQDKKINEHASPPPRLVGPEIGVSINSSLNTWFHQN